MDSGVTIEPNISKLPITTLLNNSKAPAILISKDDSNIIWFNNAFSQTFSHQVSSLNSIEELFISHLKLSEDITNKLLHKPSTSEFATFINAHRWTIRKDFLHNLALYIITFIDSSLFQTHIDSKLDFFFNNTPLPCIMFDFSSGNIEAINKALASFISIPIEHILTMNICDLLHDNKKVLETFLKNDQPYQNSFIINFFSTYYNSIFTLEVLPIIHKDPLNENSYKVVFMLSDIANAIHEERMLIQQQLSYDFITKAMTDAVLLVKDGIIKSANIAACNIWQYEQQEIIERKITDFIPDVEKLSKSVTSTKGKISFTGKRRSGNTFSGQFSLKSIGDYDSQTFIYIIVDITDKNLISQIKKLDKNMTQYILNAYPNMLAIINSNGKLINSNQAFLDFFGYSSIENFISKYEDISTLFLPGSNIHLPRWFEIKSGLDDSIVIMKDTNGEDSFFTMHSTFIHDSSNSHYIISFTDVTSIYSKKKILEDANKRLEDINDEMKEHLSINSNMLLEYQKLSTIGTMITFITHQWKQPLNAIGLISQNLYDTVNEDENLDRNSLKKMANSIMDQIFFMSETIENFNFFLKPQNTAMPFNAVTTIKNILTLLAPVISKNHIKISTNYEEPSEKIEIEGFSNHLKQVIMNIISNSKDAILEYRNKIDSSLKGVIDLRTYIDKNKLCICISDNGIGLTPDQINKIFTKNYSTKGSSGMGIGMYITNTIISNMKGSISISSKNNINEADSHGAIINIKIPIYKD